MKLRLKDAELDLGTPAVMGVLNITPDSFSDGGCWMDVSAACAQAWVMVEQGAKLIDVGGESTRPGAEPVPEQQEMDRVLPVIERLAADRLPAFLSVDTSKTAVMRAAVAAGAAMINDVTALSDLGAMEVVAASGAAVCLMHMQGRPRDMQVQPRYADVVAEIAGYLTRRAQACEAAGIARDSIVLDPGFGFGKTLDDNLHLLGALGEFVQGGYPVLVGLSRKSMLGQILGAPVDQRGHGHSAAVAIAVLQGATIVRAHDVRETLQAMKVAERVRQAREQSSTQ